MSLLPQRAEHKHPVLDNLYSEYTQKKERVKYLFGIHAAMRMDLEEYFLSKTTQPIDALRGSNFALERQLGLDTTIGPRDYLANPQSSFVNFDNQFQMQIHDKAMQ